MTECLDKTVKEVIWIWTTFLVADMINDLKYIILFWNDMKVIKWWLWMDYHFEFNFEGVCRYYIIPVIETNLITFAFSDISRVKEDFPESRDSEGNKDLRYTTSNQLFYDTHDLLSFTWDEVYWICWSLLILYFHIPVIAVRKSGIFTVIEMFLLFSTCCCLMFFFLFVWTGP